MNEEPKFYQGDKVVCTINLRYKGEVKNVNEWSSGFGGAKIFIYDVNYDKPIINKVGLSVVGAMFFGWQLKRRR